MKTSISGIFFSGKTALNVLQFLGYLLYWVKKYTHKNSKVKNVELIAIFQDTKQKLKFFLNCKVLSIQWPTIVKEKFKFKVCWNLKKYRIFPIKLHFHTIEKLEGPCKEKHKQNKHKKPKRNNSKIHFLALERLQFGKL